MLKKIIKWWSVDKMPKYQKEKLYISTPECNLKVVSTKIGVSEYDMRYKEGTVS